MNVPLTRPGCGLLVLILSSLIGSSGSASGPFQHLSDRRCYLVQMHIHGHSNHNGHDLPASMESHCHEAKRHGFDVIWWTDHAHLFAGFQNDIIMRLGDARFEADSTALVFPATSKRALSRLVIGRSSPECDAELHDRRFRAAVESFSGQRAYSRQTLTLGSQRGKVTLVGFNRPVTSGLEISVWGEILNLSKGYTFVKLHFDMSWHPGGQHHAIFELVNDKGSDFKVVGDTLVTKEVPVGGHHDFRIDLDLEEALSHLPNGDDNTLSSIWFEIGARNNAKIMLTLDSLRIRSTEPDGEHQYGTLEKLVHRYEDAYGLTQYVGVEVGLLHRPLTPHMNAYLPLSETPYGSLHIPLIAHRKKWIDGIHGSGGLVCFDHPFGATLRKGALDRYGIPAGLSVRDMSLLGDVIGDDAFWGVAKPIIEHDGFGADMLEVGYLFRGQGSLRDHLRLWDLVLANGVDLVGFGSSDSHGGPWGPGMEPNPFASWIWSTSKGCNDLLDAMRSGRLAFGDPFAWKSKLAFGVDEVIMGDTLFVDDSNQATGWIHMDPWRDDVDIRLVQVKLKRNRNVTYLRNETLPQPRGGFPIATNQPSFVRVEVYDRQGAPLVFSNPVYLIHAPSR